MTAIAGTDLQTLSSCRQLPQFQAVWNEFFYQKYLELNLPVHRIPIVQLAIAILPPAPR